MGTGFNNKQLLLNILIISQILKIFRKFEMYLSLISKQFIVGLHIESSNSELILTSRKVLIVINTLLRHGLMSDNCNRI